jgi:hypothetical protein
MSRNCKEISKHAFGWAMPDSDVGRLGANLYYPEITDVNVQGTGAGQRPPILLYFNLSKALWITSCLLGGR